jgi:hypothetical protein
MKKVIMLIILTATSASVISQDGNLPNQFYFRFGPSLPTWHYFGRDSKEDWEAGVMGMSKRIGGVFELGSIFMLNSIKLLPGMRIGINVDYFSLSYHRFSYKEYDYSSNFVYFGSKVGPSFSYSPVDKLVFDSYFKFNPVWLASSLFTFEMLEYAEDELYMGFMGIKYSIGLNVRYSIAMLGFEFNPGSAKFQYYDQDAAELTDVYLGNVDEESDKTPIPGFNFTLGLSF